MKIKAVIFDLDGTITEPYLDFNVIREEMGLAKDSGPILETLSSLDEEERRFREGILDHHERKAAEESKLNPGAKEILAKLRQAGIRIGIITRNKRSNVLAVAKKHGLEFDEIIDRDDGPIKPDAFGVTEICKRVGVNCNETLVVGDYLFDMLCAKAAGAIAVLLKNHQKADEFVQHADFCIGRLDEIFNIIKAINDND